jgi:hypothetical protein
MGCMILSEEELVEKGEREIEREGESEGRGNLDGGSRGVWLSLRRIAGMQLWPPDATGHCRVSMILQTS